MEDRRDPTYPYQTRPLQMDGVTMPVLGAAALDAVRGYLWVQARETWKAVLMGMDERQSMPGVDYESMLSELASSARPWCWQPRPRQAG